MLYEGQGQLQILGVVNMKEGIPAEALEPSGHRTLMHKNTLSPLRHVGGKATENTPDKLGLRAGHEDTGSSETL
jgi:hypothetical protein